MRQLVFIIIAIILFSCNKQEVASLNEVNRINFLNNWEVRNLGYKYIGLSFNGASIINDTILRCYSTKGTYVDTTLKLKSVYYSKVRMSSSDGNITTFNSYTINTTKRTMNIALAITGRVNDPTMDDDAKLFKELLLKMVKY